MKNLQSGDTILLASGTYSKLEMKDGRWKDFNFSETVTITSEDASKPAIIKEMLIRGASNITFEEVVFDYTGKQAANSEAWTRGKPFILEGTEGITMSNVKFDGHLENGFGAGTGLYVKESKDFALLDSDLSSFKVGAQFLNVTDATISGNEIRKMNHDGLFFAGMNDLVVEKNFIGDYKSQFPKALHKDSIQFMTSEDVRASEDVIIRGNTIENAENRHSIYMGNENYRENGDKAGSYTNILIEDNSIHGANLHGVTVVHADGLVIRSNHVIHDESRGFEQIPQINVSLHSRNVQIIGNVVDSVQDAPNDSWEVHGNATSGKSRWHYSGLYDKNGNDVEGPRSSGKQAEPDAPTTYHVSAEGFTSMSPMVIRGFDFDDGDVLIFEDFDRGTFRSGNKGSVVSDSGGSVEITSHEALKSVSYRSADVDLKASADRDDLNILIDHSDLGKVTVSLDDYYL